MALKVDRETYRRARPAAAQGAVERGAFAVNWKIVRALGLALFVWAFIVALLLSL